MEPRYSGVPVWNAKQLSAFLNIGLRQTYELLNAGDIPARKIAGSWRCYAPAVIAWLSRKEDAPTQQHVPVTGTGTQP